MARPEDAQNQPQSGQVQFSAKFLTQQAREDRWPRLLGAIAAVTTSAVLLSQSWRAYRQHQWVDISAHLLQHVLVPPVIGALLGLVGLAIGVYFLWTCPRRPQRGTS